MLREIYEDGKLVGASNTPNSTIQNFRCELVSGEDVSYLEGRLKTFIDSIIPEGQVVQNKATKDIIRVILWDWFNFISGHMTDHMREKMEWYRNYNPHESENLPKD